MAQVNENWMTDVIDPNTGKPVVMDGIFRYCGTIPDDDWVKRVERLNAIIDDWNKDAQGLSSRLEKMHTENQDPAARSALSDAMMELDRWLLHSKHGYRLVPAKPTPKGNAKGLVVTFQGIASEGLVRVVTDTLRQFRGVASVDPVPEDGIGDYITRRSAERDIWNKIRQVFE